MKSLNLQRQENGRRGQPGKPKANHNGTAIKGGCIQVFPSHSIRFLRAPLNSRFPDIFANALSHSNGPSFPTVDTKAMSRDISDEVDERVRNGSKASGLHCERLVVKADEIALQVIVSIAKGWRGEASVLSKTRPISIAAAASVEVEI